LGKKLGCGAHLAGLRRTASGKFDVTQAIALEDLFKLSRNELQERVIPFVQLVNA
jgi:tRNA pseudouridine55 synthase